MFLTKPLGVGILATALKKGKLRPQDLGKASASMCRLNRVGTDLAALAGVNAMTDVTGFGLLGHLLEICRASGVAALIDFNRVPCLTELDGYVADGLTPGGMRRNWESYGAAVGPMDETTRAILCDPQTSGGLLVAVDPAAAAEVVAVLERHGLVDHGRPIGELVAGPAGTVTVLADGSR